MSTKSERANEVSNDPDPNRFARSDDRGAETPTKLAEGTQRDIHVQGAKGLRIPTRCTSIEQFVESYHPICEDAAIFIPNARRSIGDVTQFTFTLADGQSVLVGIGSVTEQFTTQDNRFGHVGIVIALQQLARGCKPIYQQLLAARTSAVPIAADPSPAPSFARAVTAPVTMTDEIAEIMKRVNIPSPTANKTHRAATVLGIPIVSKPPAAAPVKVPAIVAPQIKKREPLAPVVATSNVDESWDVESPASEPAAAHERAPVRDAPASPSKLSPTSFLARPTAAKPARPELATGTSKRAVVVVEVAEPAARSTVATGTDQHPIEQPAQPDRDLAAADASDPNDIITAVTMVDAPLALAAAIADLGDLPPLAAAYANDDSEIVTAVRPGDDTAVATAAEPADQDIFESTTAVGVASEIAMYARMTTLATRAPVVDFALPTAVAVEVMPVAVVPAEAEVPVEVELPAEVEVEIEAVPNDPVVECAAIVREPHAPRRSRRFAALAALVVLFVGAAAAVHAVGSTSVSWPQSPARASTRARAPVNPALLEATQPAAAAVDRAATAPVTASARVTEPARGTEPAPVTEPAPAAAVTEPSPAAEPTVTPAARPAVADKPVAKPTNPRTRSRATIRTSPAKKVRPQRRAKAKACRGLECL